MIDCGLAAACSGHASRAADAERAMAKNGVCMEQALEIGGDSLNARALKAEATRYREHLSLPDIQRWTMRA
jgi:hypothetical protein